MDRIEIAMALAWPLQGVEIDALQRLDTCVVADAIETFSVRLRNTGFADSSIHCIFKDFRPMVGDAATARVRSGDVPVALHSYHDRSDWWNSIVQVRAPRIAVIEDTYKKTGVGAFVDECIPQS
jgi:4-hydroxy-4-methyl-2-oxoglutarate aldolase